MKAKSNAAAARQHKVTIVGDLIMAMKITKNTTFDLLVLVFLIEVSKIHIWWLLRLCGYC